MVGHTTPSAGHNLSLLLRPEDREALIESIMHDGGRKVRFMIEGQSSVNAAASFEADWGRIHASIEVGVVTRLR